MRACARQPDMLPLSRTLTTIKTDVPLDLGPADLMPHEGDRRRCASTTNGLNRAACWPV